LDTAAIFVVDSDSGISVRHIGDDGIQAKAKIIRLQEGARLSLQPEIIATLIPDEVICI
jgi:hypothetical protein